MIRRFENLLFPVDSDVEIVYTYLRALNIFVSKNDVKNELLEHPDSQSLLAVSDTLSYFGVENAAVRVGPKQLAEIAVPFISRMGLGEGLSLAIVKQFNDSAVTYMPSGRRRWVTTSTAEFSRDFQGIVVIGEASENAGKPGFATGSNMETKLLKNIIIGGLLIPVLVLVTLALALFQYGSSAIFPVLYSIMNLVGATLGVLLLLHEVDRSNPILRQVCSGGKSVSCDSILNSKASSIFGVGWALIGFSYFTGSLLAILMGGIMDTALFQLFSILSLTALAFTTYSIYYQWRVAKQWCVVCLCTQGVLIMQAVLIIIDGRLWISSSLVSINLILTMIVSYVIPFLTGSFIVPAFKKAKESENYRRELSRLKHNKQIFRALLTTQRAILEPTDGLGITLGRSDAKHRLIKVCNLYCGPCANAHVAIDQLLADNPDVQVQIIFTATDDNRDVKAAPTRHLLAVSDKGEDGVLKQALDDWYMAEIKDYQVFATKYPLNGEQQMQGNKIKAMREWCDKMEIRFTPTFFFDGYQLPRPYTIADLKKFRWSMTEDE